VTGLGWPRSAVPATSGARTGLGWPVHARARAGAGAAPAPASEQERLPAATPPALEPDVEQQPGVVEAAEPATPAQVAREPAATAEATAQPARVSEPVAVPEPSAQAAPVVVPEPVAAPQPVAPAPLDASGEDAGDAGATPAPADEAARRIRGLLRDDQGPPAPEPEDAEQTPIAQEAAAAAVAGRVRQRELDPFPLPAQRRVLSVANQKGGVGKTTSTVNLAVALAQRGAKVLVIDLDPQGNASTGLGVEHHSGVPDVYDVLINGTAIADVVQPAADLDGCWCVPATIDLAGAEIELVSVVAREWRLQRAIEAYCAGPGADLDYVIVDCPPSLGLLTVNAMVAARELLIPIQCEYYALEGLGQLLRSVEMVRVHLNPTLALSTILLTMYDARTRLADQVAQEVRTHFGEVVLSATIPRSVRVSEAPGYGKSVVAYDPGSRGALAYVEAAREIAVRGAVPAEQEASS